MQKTKGVLILTTAILSGISTVLCFVSLGTQYWIVSEATILFNTNITAKNSNINYGLFTGTLTRNVQVNPQNFDLTMTCVTITEESICALSCLKSPDQRESEVADLYNGTPNMQFRCTEVASRFTKSRNNDRKMDFVRESRVSEKIFIDYNIYVTTIVFLCFSALVAFVSAGFSVLNTATNPVEPWFNIWGLYFYNGIACVFILITLILWAIEFSERISVNIAIYDTLNNQSSSEDLASLGFSYWILLVAMLLHVANDVILAVREYLINREPPPPTVNMDDKQDGQIMLY